MSRPLNELLTDAYAGLTREFEHAAAEHAGRVSLGAYANVLRHFGGDPLDVRDVPRLAAISKRAAHWEIGVAERRGWVVRSNTDKLARLTDVGAAAVSEYEQCLSAAEEAWRQLLGKDTVPRLRAALVALVGQFDLELPHHPTGYGPADTSVTGGVAGRWGRRRALRAKGLPGGVFDPAAEHEAAEAWEEASGGRLYVRDTGQDWKPVERTDRDGVARLSLFALLSQTLMAFAIDYEGCGGLAMARSGNFLRHFRNDAVEIALRPARSMGKNVMLPADSTFAALERHDYADLDVDPLDKRKGRLVLTEKGRNVRNAYDDIVVAIEDRWKRRYGSDVVRSVRTALVSCRTSVKRPAE